MVALTVSPAQATVALNGRPVGVGRFLGEVEAGPNVFDLSATGYADSQLAGSGWRPETRPTWKIDLARAHRRSANRNRPERRGSEGGRQPKRPEPGDGSWPGDWAPASRGRHAPRPWRGSERCAGDPGVSHHGVAPLEAGTATLMVTTEPAGGNVRLDEGSWRKSPVTLCQCLPRKPSARGGARGVPGGGHDAHRDDGVQRRRADAPSGASRSSGGPGRPPGRDLDRQRSRRGSCPELQARTPGRRAPGEGRLRGRRDDRPRGGREIGRTRHLRLLKGGSPPSPGSEPR